MTPPPEPDDTFNLTLSAPTGAVIADAAGTATIVDDDGAAYLAIDNVAVTEPDTGTTRSPSPSPAPATPPEPPR